MVRSKRTPLNNHLYLNFHQAVFVTIEVEPATAAEVQTGFGVAFGIELYKLNTVHSHISYKGNKMGLGHGVVDGDEGFILYQLNLSVDSVLQWNRICVMIKPVRAYCPSERSSSYEVLYMQDLR